MIAMMQGYDWKFGDSTTVAYSTGSATTTEPCITVAVAAAADASLESAYLDEQEPEEVEPNEIPNWPAVTQLRVPRRRRTQWRPAAGRRAREPPDVSKAGKISDRLAVRTTRAARQVWRML